MKTKMDKVKTIIILILLTILVKTIGGFFKKDPEPVIRYEYQTDTIRVPDIAPIINPNDQGTLTMPKYQYYYKEVDNTDTIAIKELRDSLMLVINGLQSDIWISKQFFKRYPRSNKLISMNLTQDSLRLNMLQINGKVTGMEYPIYLTEFDYYFSNNKLHRIPVKRQLPPRPKDPRLRRINGYTGFGYNFLNSEPNAVVGVEIPVRRFSLQLESRLGLLDYDDNAIELTLKYRIWQ